MSISLVAVGAKVTAAITNAIINAVNAAGTALVVPSSVAGTGVSVSAAGAVTLSGATSASVNGVFTGTYDNYRIKGRLSQASASAAPTLVLRAAGTDSTATNYDETLDFANTATPASAIFLARANWQLAATVAATDFEIDLEIDSAALAAITLATGHVISYASGSAPLINMFGGGHRLASSFDGFTLVSTSALTGTLRVYGYNNG